MNNKSIEINSCRACHSSNLTPVLSLGDQYVTNFINSESEQNNMNKVPLDLILCMNCKLLQLKHNAPAESMWNEQYWYKSGISSTIKNDLKDIAEKTAKIINLNGGDLVIDIGCNDGTLLNFYNEYNKKLNLIGFEPSKNVALEASRKGFKVINNFFNAEDFRKYFDNEKAKIITAISMFYDLEYPNRFLKDIGEILDPNGIFIIQQNYLLDMLENNAFDNICHEHREYYSLISLKAVLEKYGFEIFDISFNDINGGSIRTYIKFKDNNLKGFENSEIRIKNAIQREKEVGLDTLNPYKEFASRINKIKKEIINFLEKEKKIGKKIWIYGASTRGNVALQYFGLNKSVIDGIADKNSDKWGKKTVGSLIPIFSPEDMRKNKPDYLFINTWHFFDEIKKQEAELFNKKCKFLVALPEFKVISKN